MTRTPKHEPELLRAKGRAFAARCNEIANNHDSRTIFQALELAARAHEVHRLHYVPGLSNMARFPPNRFEWTCNDSGGQVRIELLDKRTGRTAIWPDWSE
jgi:hypothetical protein